MLMRRLSSIRGGSGRMQKSLVMIAAAANGSRRVVQCRTSARQLISSMHDRRDNDLFAGRDIHWQFDDADAEANDVAPSCATVWCRPTMVVSAGMASVSGGRGHGSLRMVAEIRG
ncbi:hypothetical protein SAHL_12760 [Salinisphaera orenii YIM 95161]|uniref:Uncharacterized protein n=1 Tax=Salinisphaera orenii YIM 95161 TaxID=1051139 RepID=A0A423PLJ8_9GAMM|nr:hypothetical protein SAHL_12760 [Salinisphaera halophila YIM 95161]